MKYKVGDRILFSNLVYRIVETVGSSEDSILSAIYAGGYRIARERDGVIHSVSTDVYPRRYIENEKLFKPYRERQKTGW